MINVLINAYAVSPVWGSEPGMGWNWIINIAKYCNVFVITEGEWKKEIIQAVSTLPQKDNIHFYFNPVSDKIRQMCWNQGDWRFYWYYRKWQKEALRIAKEIIAENRIDILHQLNMIGFREPGYLWKIKNIPLVWGPVGGMASIPFPFINDTSIKYKFFYKLKYNVSRFQIKYHPRVRKAIMYSKMIAATPSCFENIKKFYGKEIPLINETGLDNYSVEEHKEFISSEIMRVIWVGKFDFRKRLDIAIKAIAEAGNPNIELYVCGSGTKAQILNAKDLSKKLGIESKVHFLGKISHEQILQFMHDSDLMLFTSISDATSTVVSEAIYAGLPILSHNLCGFGSIVDDFGGWTIPANNPEDSVIKFGKILNYLQRHPEELKQKSLLEKKNCYKLSWDFKMKKLLEIYNSLL